MLLKLSKIVVGVTLFFLTFSLTAVTATIASPQTDYDATSQNFTIDSRAHSKVKESISFKFSAQDICNDNVGKNGLCLDIWGKGSISDNTITASGILETYRGKPVDFNKGKWLQLSRGQWSAVDLLTATEKQISFKASTGSGIVFIKLIEGKSERAGLVCAYGPLIALQKAEDAVCVDDAFVVVGKNGK